MKKMFSLAVVCAALFAFAEEDPFSGYTKYYWNKLDGGNWTTAENWVMEDGKPATSYPKSLTDAAIFNGTNPQKNITIPGKSTNDVGIVYLEDGLTSFKFASSAGIHFQIQRLLREDHALLSISVDGWNWTDPGDFIIENRDELIVDGCIPGATWRKDDGNWGEPRSVTINEETFMVTHVGDSAAQDYQISSSVVWPNHYTLLYGNWADNRNIVFKGDYILTVPSGQLGPLSLSHVGTTSSQYQGTIAADGPIYFLSRSAGINFRPIVQAPAFVQAANGTTVYCDDHSTETCDYYVTVGTMQLGSTNQADAAVRQLCTLGTNDVYVGWRATLDVQCEGALQNVSVLHINSYRGQGEIWGKVMMSDSDVVLKAYLDDKPLRHGVYGATGSGADYIDDEHFLGTGTLTVRKDDIPGMKLVIR